MITIRTSLCASLVLLLSIVALPSWSDELSTISGSVVDEHQQPIINAQVFLEQGLLSPVVRVITDDKGHFTFTNVLSGTVGVVAHIQGHAFNGFSLKIGTGDIRTGNTIVLSPSGQLSGQVVGIKKKPLGQAYITHVLLQQAKVTIPYIKLRKFGFNLPTTDTKGRFTLNDLPLHETVALKVTHKMYAQGVLAGLAVGEKEATVTLTPGVMVSGTVRSSETQKSIAKVAIIFRNNRPPYNTVITQAGSDGVYLIRLQPGEYTYESVGTAYTSVTKPSIIISGQLSTEEINLSVAPKVIIRGKIMDAITGKGIAGARVRLENQGKLNAFATTGSQGTYTFSAPAGQATIRFIEAAGYSSPPKTSYTIPVKAGDTPATPTFWLVTLPVYSLAVVDENQQPVSKAIVQVLDPPQIGWRTTNDKGMVEITLGSLPKSGRVMGYSEHPTKALGAAFSIEAKDAHQAIVQLTPQRTVHGRVINDKGQAMAGWSVACQIAQEGTVKPITLWNTVTDAEGKYHHPGVLEGVPLLYSATNTHKSITQITAPLLFTLKEKSLDNLPDLITQGGVSGKTLIGKKFPWRNLGGTTLDEISKWKGERIILFVPTQLASIVLKSSEQQQEILHQYDKRLILVVNGAHNLHSSTIPIGSGEAPAPATVYIISADNRVVAEGNDLPTLSRIRTP